MYASWIPRQSSHTCVYWCPNSGENATYSWPYQLAHTYVLVNSDQVDASGLAGCVGEPSARM
jgi:hypothetical protein